MSKSASPSPAARRPSLHRWVRQLHLWIGAWGALAAVLYGFTGLIMAHRFGEDAWYQGDSNEIEKREIAIPAEARGSAEALSLWLREHEGLDALMIRKPEAGRGGEGRGGEGRGGEARPGANSGARPNGTPAGGDAAKAASRGGEGSGEGGERWALNGGTARESWSVEYVAGEPTARFKRTRHTALAAFLRLHKAADRNLGWRLLVDSFAIGMILLGLSGLWMWARNRSLKDMALSVFAVSVVVLLIVLVPSLA